jgi:glycerate-2-kinase
VHSAVEIIKDFLETKEFMVEFFSDTITGEAKAFGEKMFNEYFINLENSNQNFKQKALIGSGELTVTIKGKGNGGRNQEMLLSFLNEAIKNQIRNNFCFLGVNLDGIEGNSEAMGALVDNEVKTKTLKLNLNLNRYLDDNDSNTVFKTLGTEIITGPTGCNVNDIIILLYERNS